MRTGTSCLQIPFLEARVGVLRLPLASPLFVDPKAAGYQPELRSRVQNIFPLLVPASSPPASFPVVRFNQPHA